MGDIERRERCDIRDKYIEIEMRWRDERADGEGDEREMGERDGREMYERGIEMRERWGVIGYIDERDIEMIYVEDREMRVR